MSKYDPDTLRSTQPKKLDLKRVRPEAVIREDLRGQLHQMYTRWHIWIGDESHASR